jgi:integrase
MTPLLEIIMRFIASLPAGPQTWLLNSPLAPHLDAFAAHLADGGYSAQTTRKHFLGVAHFARWMTQCALPVSLLDEQLLQQFLNVHLSHCSCPPPAVCDPSKHRRSLVHLMVVLRKSGAAAEVSPAVGPIPDELRRFDEYMRNARGMSEGTRRGCLRWVQRLLLHKFAGEAFVFAKLQPEDLRKFIAIQLDLLGSVSNAMSLASALRTYFGYRTICGDPVHGLLGVISAPAHWRLASLPRGLRPDEVDRLLASFDSSVPSALRGYAIVRCALDLGLRSNEVTNLRLCDIDWKAGTVTLKHTKSLRVDVLPLPAATGQALADYVQNERPKTSSPFIFVRLLPPRDAPLGVHGIRAVISNAFKRIGLSHGRTHALRHTMACRLLEHGSSLKEVADVLRHRSLNTSLIYAKLDTPRLAAVALAWPGSTT